jgi:hypothetical protein
MTVGRALVVVLVAVSAAPVAAAPGPAPIPSRVRDLIAQHCADCHDKDHRLDLTTLPAPDQRQVWFKIRDKVASLEMPPIDPSTIEGRYPLEPEIRAELVREIEQHILGAAADPPRPARFLDPRVWLSLTQRWVAPVIGRDRFAELTAPLGGARTSSVAPAFTDRRMATGMQMTIDRTSVSVCRAVAETEMAKPSAARTLLPRGDTPADGQAAFAALARAVFGRASADVEGEIAIYRKFEAKLADPAKAWTAMCVLYLSGPRLWYGVYAR